MRRARPPTGRDYGGTQTRRREVSEGWLLYNVVIRTVCHSPLYNYNVVKPGLSYTDTRMGETSAPVRRAAHQPSGLSAPSHATLRQPTATSGERGASGERSIALEEVLHHAVVSQLRHYPSRGLPSLTA